MVQPAHQPLLVQRASLAPLLVPAQQPLVLVAPVELLVVLALVVPVPLALRGVKVERVVRQRMEVLAVMVLQNHQVRVQQHSLVVLAVPVETEALAVPVVREAQ